MSRVIFYFFYVSYKDRKAFANDLKMIYNAPSEQEGREALDEVTEKWTMPIHNWGKVYGELAIMYDGRLSD